MKVTLKQFVRILEIANGSRGGGKYVNTRVFTRFSVSRIGVGILKNGLSSITTVKDGWILGLPKNCPSCGKTIMRFSLCDSPGVLCECIKCGCRFTVWGASKRGVVAPEESLADYVERVAGKKYASALVPASK